MADGIYQIKVYFVTKLCRHVAALIPPHILLFTLICQDKMAFINESIGSCWQSSFYICRE